MEPLKEFKETQKAIKEKIFTLMVAGFGVVAALAWNDAIQNSFSKKRRNSRKIYLRPNYNNNCGNYFFTIKKIAEIKEE